METYNTLIAILAACGAAISICCAIQCEIKWQKIRRIMEDGEYK